MSACCKGSKYFDKGSAHSHGAVTIKLKAIMNRWLICKTWDSRRQGRKRACHMQREEHKRGAKNKKDNSHTPKGWPTFCRKEEGKEEGEEEIPEHSKQRFWGTGLKRKPPTAVYRRS
ncbi:hypothetical protein GOP47_0019489 [Adiantum capillus-veneris]|uniref:Uncharacterized protein n=1 Tax=Adiantum capillus-veneris TaxID=13818 RepID=A0A9D4Z7V6_ADICA|nr:hypothetical protein GOP47_0019489 [Adiantum capillus-veneris]